MRLFEISSEFYLKITIDVFIQIRYYCHLNDSIVPIRNHKMVRNIS
jgi:hypothetical protein